MKKQWLLFLVKLFGPGLLALPWLVLPGHPWIFYPIKMYTDGSTYLYDQLTLWLVPLMYGGFLFAVIAPLIFLKQKPKSWRWILSCCWIFTAGFYAASQWPPFDFIYRLEKGISLLITGIGCFILAISYLRLFFKSKHDGTRALRLHYAILAANLSLSVFIAFYYFAGASLISFFNKEIDTWYFIKVSINIMAIANYAIYLFAFITHYFGSIRHFYRKDFLEKKLIDKIGLG